MSNQYLKHARAVDHTIRDIVLALNPETEGLAETQVLFKWLDETAQPSFEQQAEVGNARLCWLEMVAHQHSRVRPAGGRMMESAILHVSYPVGAFKSPAQAHIMMRADSYALFDAINVRAVTSDVLASLRATQSRIIERPGISEVVAAYIHQIPLQWEQVLT